MGCVMIQTHRGVVVAGNGAVCASQPLSVGVGLGVLQRGGTAFDAAIAVSACQVVTEPYSNHLGGDAFALCYVAKTGEVVAFNGSGAAPAAATRERFGTNIPARGLQSATIPGLVDCWFTLHRRLGTVGVRELLEPALDYAEHGFPAGYRYARTFASLLAQDQPGHVRDAVRTLTGLDAPPRPGEVIRQPDLAWSLGEIAAGGRDAFYAGSIAERLCAFSRANGGLFTDVDLAQHRTDVREPISTTYRGFTVYGQPPVSQGAILLEEMNLVEGYDLAQMGWGSPDAQHVMIEAKKLAFADRHAFLGDPRFVRPVVDELLSKEYASRRRGAIRMEAAAESVPHGELQRDTTYFCVADREGNAVSFIQSVFHLLGCGVVADGTGILFNNRMTGFSLDPSSPNSLEPGRRPIHTLNTFLITRGRSLAYVGGTPGGHTQVQSNLQVIVNAIDYGMDPQSAIEAPRWEHGGSLGDLDRLGIETRFPEATIAELARRGHRVEPLGPWGHGSSFQLIAVDGRSGAFHAGSDPRCDGQAAGW